MATLLPYCLGKVKRREGGEATFTQTPSLHYSSCPSVLVESVETSGLMHVSELVWVATIGCRIKSEHGEADAIIAANSAMHPATPRLCTTVLK